MPPIFPKSISDVQYIYRTSNIYIRRPISICNIQVPISDIRVPISNIRVTYIRCLISILDVRYLYLTSDIQYPTSARAGARTRARARAGISDVGYRYRTSDIYIGRLIYILDVRYRFRKHWWHFVLNGASCTPAHHAHYYWISSPHQL